MLLQRWRRGESGERMRRDLLDPRSRANGRLAVSGGLPPYPPVAKQRVRKHMKMLEIEWVQSNQQATEDAGVHHFAKCA